MVQKFNKEEFTFLCKSIQLENIQWKALFQNFGLFHGWALPSQPTLYEVLYFFVFIYSTSIPEMSATLQTNCHSINFKISVEAILEEGKVQNLRLITEIKSTIWQILYKGSLLVLKRMFFVHCLTLPSPCWTNRKDAPIQKKLRLNGAAKWSRSAMFCNALCH